MVILYITLLIIQQWNAKLLRWLSPSSASYGRRKSTTDDSVIQYRSQPKPEWVRKEIIKMKALMLGNCSCVALPSAVHGGRASHRTIRGAFNHRLEATNNMTVGKTYVRYTIKNHLYEIRVLRKKVKQRKPRAMPKILFGGWMTCMDALMP